MPAILADSNGNDDCGFDSTVGSDDDIWHVLSAFDKHGSYVNTIAEPEQSFDSLVAVMAAGDEPSILSRNKSGETLKADPNKFCVTYVTEKTPLNAKRN